MILAVPAPAFQLTGKYGATDFGGPVGASGVAPGGAAMIEAAQQAISEENRNDIRKLRPHRDGLFIQLFSGRFSFQGCALV